MTPEPAPAVNTRPFEFARTEPVPRLAWTELEPEGGLRDLLAARSPVILEGALADTAFADQTPVALGRLIGPKKVAAYYVDGADHATLGPPTDRRHEILAFDEFVDRSGGTSALGPADRRYYLTQCRDVLANYPMLAEALPSIPKPGPLSESNIFCGSEGLCVGTHQDPGVHAFLAQVAGDKRIVMFAPPMAPYLYPHSLRSFNAVHSRVEDIDAPDLDRFPLFAMAHAWTGMLTPGCILYIPPFWWHNIRTRSWSFSFSFFSPDPEFVAGQPLLRSARLAAAVAAELETMSPYYADYCAARIAAELLGFDRSPST